ncbi:MAG: ABC transporter ATP-binding protein [Thermoleophilia bacterium]|nr:ABC transporter ATP-binding protein [Thermoleophilia bacterium]
MSGLLEIEDLKVSLPVEGEDREVLSGISLEIMPGEALGLVGESGSGKSMTANAIARLLPDGAKSTGKLTFDGREVLSLKGGDLRGYRTKDVSVIFQDPRTHINPVRRIGDFMTEALVTNAGVSNAEAHQRAVVALAEVGIPDGERRLQQYPHELSGGLLQRVMIAAAILTRPRLLLADEPTTALDVTTQSEVMAILADLRERHSLAMLFITHDLDLASATCDRICVMYAGRIAEMQPAASLTHDPLHPYTAALMEARPRIDEKLDRLAAIPGQPLSAFEAPDECAFAPRCTFAQDACLAGVPPVIDIGAGHSRCIRAEELRASSQRRPSDE